MSELIKKALGEIKSKKNSVEKDYHRLDYHLMAPTGLINDPNGFSYYRGKYHLFYQWNPFECNHKTKFWGHFQSEDLVSWENKSPVLAPEDWYDKNGCYSGSAIEKDGQLILFYTGNVKDQYGNRETYQCLAVSDNGEEFQKLGPVITNQPNGYTRHFRDPKVWKDREIYYSVIGAQRDNLTGAAVLYSSNDIKNWSFLGEIKTDLENFGYMWECPDYFEINGEGVFIFSPQGIDAENDKYNNIYQSGYVLGKLDPKTVNLRHGEFSELDRGFDFYAPQTMIDKNGRRIMMAWAGLPEVDYPTENMGWLHCLTMPRELLIIDGKLVQKPVEEMKKIRKDFVEVQDLFSGKKSYPDIEGDSFEMICRLKSIDAGEVGINLRVGNNEKTVLKYDYSEKKVILDRGSSGEIFAEEYGTVRKCFLDSLEIVFHIFMDKSLIEVFINDGEEVFTARIFPDEKSSGIEFFSDGKTEISIKKWNI
ncbi:sucrose-6-phosphate hydrolase [uncultured Ilyobacter sp.]|uniref:glycoside hydrolase family 32 protein n=1 Tax=uncultured Ilyobacter sp. TaxID=544433 RepID=UPI0029C84926|nr:sucrose-6-phosphate hydrolase [uncultured Ilyobacter sp.]